MKVVSCGPEGTSSEVGGEWKRMLTSPVLNVSEDNEKEWV